MSQENASIYRIQYDATEWLSDSGIFRVLHVPVEIANENDSYSRFLVLVDTNGIGIYETEISPLVDVSKFGTQVLYFNWAEVNQYVVDDNGDEWWVGYNFGNDDYWTDILTAIANYYYAVTHSTGTIKF